MLIFDTGTLFVVPPGATPTPLRIGGLQDVRIQLDVELNATRTQLKFPVKHSAALNGIQGRARMAKIDGAAFAQVAYGKSTATGSRKVTLDFEATPTAGPDPTVTITPPTGTFALDLGVIKDSDGARLTRTDTTPVPATGQYSVVGSAYHFYTGDAGAKVRISYAYDATTGKKLALSNEYMQFAPTYSVMLFTEFNCKQFGLWLPAVATDQLVMPARLEQYEISEFGFKVQQNAAGEIGTFSFGE